MTPHEIAKKLIEGIGKIPDIDGEPGYYASCTGLKETEDRSSFLMTIEDGDDPACGETFEITVRWFGG